MLLYGILVTVGTLAILASIYSQLLGRRFDHKATTSVNRTKRGFTPSACVIMACKGEERGLRENIEALVTQTYPKYRIILVTDTSEDAAYSVARMVLDRHPNTDALLLVADSHPNASGKVAALLTALARDGWESEAYAFVDSDALITRRWLADIIDPLGDAAIGATTGFRWYFPVGQGVWSHVQSAWNASGTNLMFDTRYNFPWGGAMAILGETLKAVEILNVWETALSDDLSLNAVLRERSYRTVFLPQCTVVSHNQTSARSFLEWATRQVAITRVFNHKLWNYGLGAYAFFTATTVMAAFSFLLGIVWSEVWFLPALLLFAPSLLGILRSNQRTTTFKRAVPEFAAEFDRNRWADAVASLIVPWVMTYCILRSARMREIVWRDRKYTLIGKTALASTRSLPHTAFQKGT